MIKRKHQALATVFVVIDAAASCLALLVAYWLRFALEVIPVTKESAGSERVCAHPPSCRDRVPLAFASQGLYRFNAGRTRARRVWSAVAMGDVLGAILLSGVLLWLRPAESTTATRARLSPCSWRPRSRSCWRHAPLVRSAVRRVHSSDVISTSAS